LLRLSDHRLIVEDRASGQPLLTEAEAEHAARISEQNARIAAEARARAAEEELHRLREQLRQRGDQV
jgi:hypothetical protein